MEIAYEVRLAEHCYSRLLFLQMQVMWPLHLKIFRRLRHSSYFCWDAS